MVFESVVTDVLNKVLGDYVENLDKTQLKIGIWGGDVVLDNLKLRENSLDELNLPVQLVYGYLGKLVLKIPWKNLYSQPVIAQIEDFYLLITPKTSVAYIAEKEEKNEYNAKVAALLALEEVHKKELEANKEKPNESFAEKLTAQIVNNLQIKITNVHLRYEDNITTTKPFALGITLHDLDLYTTDENWEKHYLAQQVTRVFKLANLDSLSLYMNCTVELFSRREKIELAQQFRESIAKKDFTPVGYNFVLGPISSIAKLQLNMNPEYDKPPFEIPKIHLNLEMEKLYVGLTSTQFQGLLKLGESMNRMQLGMRYRKYRPFDIPYKNNARIWWNFTITAVLEEDIRKRNISWTWEHIKEHCDLCRDYATSFKEKELSKKPSASLIERCALLEQKLDLFNLILIRKRMHIEIDKIRKEDEERRSERSWFGSWFGGGDKAKDDERDITKRFEAAMTPEEREKLNRAIGYQENAPPTNMPENYEAIQMNFKLVALEVGLYDSSIDTEKSASNYDIHAFQTIMLLKFSMATCSVNQRPGANAISITAGMKELTLTGLETDDTAPMMIKSKVTDEFNLLDIFFETNPLDKMCDKRIKVLARPLEIYYHAATVIQLAKVFSPPQAVNLSEFETAATDKISNFKERSATGMQYMIDSKDVMEIDIKFMPNIFVIPNKGTYEGSTSSLIVVTLGQLHITSIPHTIESSSLQSFNLEEVFKNAYDKIHVAIKDMQVMVVKPQERWEEILMSAILSEMHILRPTSMTATLHMCVVGDDPRLPKNKIDIDIPFIAINLTEDRIFEALGVVTSIPLPEASEPATSQLTKAISVASSKMSLSSFLNQDGKKQRKKQSVATDLTEEIVQYTDLELHFKLNEINITLNKSSPLKESPTDSNAFTTPVEEMTADVVEFEERVDELPCTESMTNIEPILSFHVLELGVDMYKRTYELVVEANLGAVRLLQHDHCDKIDSQLSIIDTPRFSEELKYLLTASYVMAERSSPEFFTKYNATVQLITINFSTLTLTLHQECLQRLLEIVNNFQGKLEAITPPSALKNRVATADDSNILQKLAVIAEETENDEVSVLPSQTAKPSRSRKVVDSIQIHVKANMEQVALVLTCRKRPLASLQVKQFNANVILKSSYTELTMVLKDILVTDLNTQTIHNNILSIVGSNALDCQVVMYNLDETSNYNSDDMKVTVSIGCMKIVFLNWFVTSVLNFLSNVQLAQEALAQASAAVAETATQNAMQAYEKATRMKLDIKIKAPIIIVPVDSMSRNAIALDLGFLSLSNSFSVLSVPNDSRPAVIDDIKLELKNVKLSKVSIISEDHRENESGIQIRNAVDTVDLAYGIHNDINILDPISFTLAVKRNLSSAWYHELPEMDLSGRLKSIDLNLFMEDYALFMAILNRNLNEGTNEFPPVVRPKSPKQSPVHKTHSDISRKTSQPTLKLKRATLPQTRQSYKKVYEQMKFNFLFDGIIVNLLLENRQGLARFGIYFLSLKGNKLVDGTLSTSVVLCNIQIDDTRTNTESKIKKYLCRKDWKYKDANVPEAILEACRAERNFMVDLTAIIKEDDTFAEVRVCGFDLILCIDYLLKLADFFRLPEEAEAIRTPELPKTPKQSTSPEWSVAKAQTNPQDPVKKMNLILHVEEPDIILVESLHDVNTNAIIFNAQAQLNYRSLGDKQIINGQIDSLKMYMCAFLPEKREATRHYILHPCVISLQGSTPEEEGLHISIKFSEIILNVSPATIELFNKAKLTISADTAEKAATLKQEADYSNIWRAKEFEEKDFWFLRVDQAEDALEVVDIGTVSPENKVKTERCIIEMPCITLVVETGIGYYTTPLISIDTRLNAAISDWSSSLKIRGSLSLNMNYFNEALAMWEPIIEMNEHINQNGEQEYLPWELNYKMDIETKKSEINEDSEENTTKISIQSEENMEITMTKSCLNLLNDLSAAFSEAIDSKGLTKPAVIAPYIVENDTGFDISINFAHGIFTLHECHMPKATTVNAFNGGLIFQVEGAGADLTSEQVKYCKVSPGGRVYLQTKDLSTLQCEEDEEYNLYVKIGDINKEVMLPATKSVKRYFPLYRASNQDPWGIVSEVSSEYGTTTVNIHGVVNVYNHFATTVNIYRYKSPTNEKILVGSVAPETLFHVPLHAIYADDKNFYFAIDGYKISVQGVTWNDCPTDLEYTRQLQCDPVETFETFYINVVRAKREIFHENSDKFTILSAFYTLHIRPPLYLCNALPICVSVSVAGCTVKSNPEENLKAIMRDSDSDSDIDNRELHREDMLDYGEKQVSPGDVLHLPTVKLSSKTGRGSKSYIVIRLIQYLEKDWSCTTEISRQHKEMATWTFSSYDSEAKMDLDLFVRFGDRFGSLMVTLYSPFWMINKTELMLSYKTDAETVDVLYHPPEYCGPILFSFREKYFFDKKAAKIRVDNGDWSNKIPLDVAGSTGSVTCKSKDMSYQIGVHNHLTHNSFTKLITFIPFYMFVNKCDFLIELQEQNRPGDSWLQVFPNRCTPFWPKSDLSMMIVARVDEQLTVPFKYSEAQCTLLKLADNKYGGINVDVQVTEGGVYTTFSNYNPGDAPGLLINHMDVPVAYYEKNTKDIIEVGRRTKILHAWADPTGENSIFFGKNKVENDLRRDGVGELILPDGTKGFWVSFLDGLQRVLLFTQDQTIVSRSETSSQLQSITQSLEVRIHGIGFSLMNNMTGAVILYMGIASSGVIWETQKSGKKVGKQMNIHDTVEMEKTYQEYLIDKSVEQENKYYLDGKYEIDFENMILLKNKGRKLIRTFYPGVWMCMNTSPFQTQIHAKIHKIQIDNQLPDLIFPVVLAPIAPPKSMSTSTVLKPFIECSIIQRVVPNSTVQQFKYATMLVQEFHLKVDLIFLTAIADMFESDFTDEQAAKLFTDDVDWIIQPIEDLVAQHSMQEQKNFYDNLHLGPLKIHVSFSMAGAEPTALPGILATLVKGIGVTLTDINDVVFRLAYFEREYRFFTQQQLTSEIIQHYKGQAIKQLYVLVLGLDVLGNPYGLVVGIKKGVGDLFYEPFQGAIQGPGEFAEGLALGVRSLFGHTVGGAAGAVSKITGAMGKGLAALTFDDDYQKKRRINLNKKPATFSEGIARSSKSLVMGFVDGVTGVVMKPVAGAKEEGVEGFFKGLGKGAIGFVAHPTSGVVDFASGCTDAVKRAAEGHGGEVARLRPPRFIYQDNVVRPYCRSEATGNKMFKEIEKGKYAGTDIFVHWEEIVPKQEYILVSNHRVVYVSKNELFGNYTLHWKFRFVNIDKIVMTEKGVEIVLKKVTKKVMGMFSTSEVVRKYVEVADLRRRRLLVEKLESQLKQA